MKNEIKLNENTLEKFKNISGINLKELKDKDLENLGLKLGERRKLIKFSQSNALIEITVNSTVKQVCEFLKVKFEFDEDNLKPIQEYEIDGKKFLNIAEDDFEDLNINDIKKQKNILDYIQQNKLKNLNKDSKEQISSEDSKIIISDESEEEIPEEEIFKHYLLIDILEYFTSEEDINNCPSNNLENFIQLCEDMDINNENNCAKINFDQADKIKLKSATLWGTKEGLFEFFEERKMKRTIEYFKDEKIGSGVVLAIKEDKSFAYIIIWPGKMSYLYKEYDEPQKSLLLTLLRIGFSLSNDYIFCLSKEQRNEFDFQGINELYNANAFKITIGEVKFNDNNNDFFKLDKNIKIDFDSNEIEGNIKNIKVNKGSIFIYMQENEKVCSYSYHKIPFKDLNFNIENVYFHKSFEIDDYILYKLLEKFKCFAKLLEENKYIYLDKYRKERYSEIKNSYNKIFTKIENINFVNLECEICKTKMQKHILCGNDENNNFHLFHKSCLENNTNSFSYECQKSDNIFLIYDKEIKYENIFNYIKSELSKNNNRLIDEMIKNSIKEKLFFFNMTTHQLKNSLTKLKNEIDNFMINKKDEILNVDQKYNKIKLHKNQWRERIITKINNEFNQKSKNISKWIEFTNVNYNQNKKEILFTYTLCKRDFLNCKVKLYNFYPYSNEEKYILKYNDLKKWDEDEFENYFIKDTNGGILIKRNENYFEFQLKKNKNKNIRFNSCYDYNNSNQIIIIINKTNSNENAYTNIKENINIYFLFNNESKGFYNTKWITMKLMIIPTKYDDRYLVSLFFHDNKISLVKLEENFEELANLNLETNYQGYNLNKLQFLVYKKFLLIFYYDNFWECDVYTIFSNTGVFFNKIESKQNYFNLKEKTSKFSIVKLKNDIILYYCYIKNNKLIIEAKKVQTSLYSLEIEHTSENKENENQFLNINEGNCALNYFYHSFKKYPSIGALQYNYFKAYSDIKKNFYLSFKDKKKSFETYFNELKNRCRNERGLDIDDLKYEFKGRFLKRKLQNQMGLGTLIIKFIELVPIQIAKIKNYYFKAMSNGKDIKIEDLYNKYAKNEISIKEKADYINFGIKNSIFNYYDLPVIVLVYMGVQSIGKSTLSNEISLSLFNVSGMRCTEGIWMAVSLFKGIKSIKNCNSRCNICSKNKCYLLEHSIDIKCICKNCCCGEICCLLNEKENIKEGQNCCNKICALPKGHKKDREHICEISPYNHGFICVSLDFEGLGTFERSLEQDIDLAMIGAAMGNSILLRVDKTIDTFLASRLENWAEGSKNINTTNSKNYFGGNLIFCQKDVLNDNADGIKREFDKQINESLRNWLKVEQKRNIRKLDLKNFPIYGIFSKFINSPTPIFNQNQFHSFLRNNLIHILIRNTLIKKSLPNFRTGCEFMESLKNILAVVDIHDYNVLDSIAIDNLKEYINENKNKAVEILGIYPNTDQKIYESFEAFENDLRYNLEELKYSYISNKEKKIEEKIIIKIICNNKKAFNSTIKYDESFLKITLNHNNIYNKINLSPKSNIKTNKIFNNFKNKQQADKIIQIKKEISPNKRINNILDKEDSTLTQELKIEGFRDFGLLLLIPYEYKEQFSLEDIRKKLFLLWKKIGESIKLSVYEMIKNFELFIKEIINRRERNIKNWLSQLTSSFNEDNFKRINNLNIALNEKWNLCKESCSFCFYKCTKILGHINEHNCGFDHICQEKCQTCLIVKCNESGVCDNLCHNKKAGHKNEPHSCSHFHFCRKICSKINLRGCGQTCKREYGHKGNCSCKEIHLCHKFCIYKDCSVGCKIECNLEIGHNGEHICDSNEHKCILECSFKNKSKGCINSGICALNLPHSIDNHNCGGNHKCIEKCNLMEITENCGIECTLPYGHFGEHICNNIHKCKEYCHLFEKSQGCGIKCSLEYGHDLEHICNEKHYCNNYCYYYKKSNNCLSEKCSLEYSHTGKCNCGEKNHLCSEKCSKENCNNTCKLLCEHEEKLHNCKEFHKCYKACSLKYISKKDTCNNICKLELGHNGDCICSFEKEKHICNKYCKKCSKPCKLITNHEKECRCGRCICGENCIYRHKSHNCKQKCINLYGHTGPHICEVKTHLCIENCIYKEKSRNINGGCLNYCILPMGHDESSFHFCGIKKEKHICSGICFLFSKSTKVTCDKFCSKSIEHEGPCLCKYSEEKHICKNECSLKGIKGCKIFCFLPANHFGKCLCLSGEKGHLCDKECSYFSKTRIGCKGKCILPFSHPKDQMCICSNSINKHIHKGICYLKNKTREGCTFNCKFPVNHGGNCICEKSSNLHICNHTCKYKDLSFEGSCHKYCINQAGHFGDHICGSRRHECKEPCKYKDISKNGCLGHCCKEVGHKDPFYISFFFNLEHLCKNEKGKHICNSICELKNKSREGCKGICDKQIEHSGSHLCNSENHICKEPCYYSNKYAKKCNGLCVKKSGHKDKHECDVRIHFCAKICYMNTISRFCDTECCLPCAHEGNCICKKKSNEHFCNKKCKLCADYCCYVFNHDGNHLCKKEHDCSYNCNTNGICEIKTNNIIEIKKVYKLKLKNQKIEFFENNEQIFKRKKCILKIPKGSINHKGKHICDIEIHKCGFKCKQCDRLCELEYGHPSYHYCKHGHIKNSVIQTEDKSVKINYNIEKYDFQNEEEAIMFTCYQYCKEQKRGHVHRLKNNSVENIKDNLKSDGIRKLNNNIYECKCEFFWKIFLGFRFETEFNNDLISEFDKCPSKCGLCQISNSLTFCSLQLWHKEKNHVFPCKHGKLPYHTIFIIDKSDSMGSPDIKPSESKIYKNEDFNNRLGCVIQVINSYVNKRLEINKNDIFSLISFSTGAEINFRDFDKDKLSNINLIEECIKLIGYPRGDTRFIKGFNNAKIILEDIDKNKYNPLIILLSDGDDDKPEETIDYVKEVSKYKF